MDAEPRKDKTDEKHVPPYDPLLPPRNLEEMSVDATGSAADIVSPELAQDDGSSTARQVDATAPNEELADMEVDSEADATEGIEEAFDATESQGAAPSMADTLRTGIPTGEHAPPPDRPYFGPVKSLADLPNHIIEALDDESAATLQAVLDNPDQFDPKTLDHTSIKDEFMALSRAASNGSDYEPPWFHGPLPPLRLEVMLVRYDWMVEKAIDRAARQIDRNTEGKLDSKLNSLLFMLRAEMRSLLR